MDANELSEWLSVVPARKLAEAMREQEDWVLWGLRGDVFSFQAGYRLVCRWIVGRSSIPKPHDLPLRFISDLFDRPRAVVRARPKRLLAGTQYAALVERVELAIQHIARCYAMRLTPVTNIVFDFDLELERTRRAAIYEKQWAELEADWGDPDDPSRMGPYARPVRCSETGETFVSARAAARWIKQSTGREVQRSDLRTAIKRKTRCGGFTWRYVQGAVAALVPTGRERAVECVETSQRFASQGEAARSMGRSPSMISGAADDGTAVVGRDGAARTFRRVLSKFQATVDRAKAQGFLFDPSRQGVA